MTSRSYHQPKAPRSFNFTAAPPRSSRSSKSSAPTYRSRTRRIMPSHSSFWRSTARRRGRQRPDRYSTGSGSDLAPLRVVRLTRGARSLPLPVLYRRPTHNLFILEHASVSASKKDRRKTDCGTPAPAQEPTARISMRAVSALEIASVFVSVIIISWAIVPLQHWRRWVAALPALLAMALMINSQRARGESLREVGLGAEHFFRALRLLAAPTLIACAGFAAIGYSTGSFHRTSHFWATALWAPVWALIQQYA